MHERPHWWWVIVSVWWWNALLANQTTYPANCCLCYTKSVVQNIFYSNSTFSQEFDFLSQSNHCVNSKINLSQMTLLVHLANKAGNLKLPTWACAHPLGGVLVIRLRLVHRFLNAVGCQKWTELFLLSPPRCCRSLWVLLVMTALSSQGEDAIRLKQLLVLL